MEAQKGAEKPEILIIQTGGTIDKRYPRQPGAHAFKVGESAVRAILCRVQPEIRHHLEPMFQLDSNEMTHEHREAIAAFCVNSGMSMIVITHGTDTMIKTATHLSLRLRLMTDEMPIVVLTGSALPASDRETDAEFNLGFACGVVQTLTPDVYIAMQGRVYTWNGVERDSNGRFIEKVE